MAKLVSKIYGDALFERVVEDGMVDAMYEEVKQFAAMVKLREDSKKKKE